MARRGRRWPGTERREPEPGARDALAETGAGMTGAGQSRQGRPNGRTALAGTGQSQLVCRRRLHRTLESHDVRAGEPDRVFHPTTTRYAGDIGLEDV